jgi:hypothetical protein
VLRFENCEEWGDGASGYECSVQRIALADVPPAEIESALRSCGWEFDELVLEIRCSHSGEVIARREEPAFELVLLECLTSYGIYSPMGSEVGESYPLRVRAAARRLAEELMADSSAQSAALARPVNALGATAEEFGRGECDAPLRRTAAALVREESPEVSPEEDIMLRMYAAAGGRTLGGKVETELAAAGQVLKDKEE